MNTKSSAAASLSAAACPAPGVPHPAATGWAAVLCAAVAYFGATSVAQAGVEYVTPLNACNAVDTISDGKDLRLYPGRLRFDVWGSGIDVNPAVSGGFGATIVGRRNGATNAAGPCKKAIGSVTVEVNPSVTATTDERRILQFRMPLGDLSPLPVTVFAYRSFDYRWTGPESTVTCLGTQRQDLNNDRLTITLPAGAQTDTSNCFGPRVTSSTFFSSNLVADLRTPARYQITGLPAWLRLEAGSDQGPGGGAASPAFLIDSLTLRRITTPQTVQITATAPNGRANTMTLVVNPGATL